MMTRLKEFLFGVAVPSEPMTLQKLRLDVVKACAELGYSEDDHNVPLAELEEIFLWQVFARQHFRNRTCLSIEPMGDSKYLLALTGNWHMPGMASPTAWRQLDAKTSDWTSADMESMYVELRVGYDPKVMIAGYTGSSSPYRVDPRVLAIGRRFEAER
jgi:hypothetical protein